MKMGKAINFDISIQPSHNKGFLVTVGCGKFVFADGKSLCDALREYLKAPKE